MSLSRPRCLALSATVLFSSLGVAGLAVGAPAANATAAASVNAGGKFLRSPGTNPGPAIRRHLRRGLFAATPIASLNWAGYIQAGASGTYTAVQDSWVVPTVSGNGRKFSSDWVGIGGYNDSTLVQAGTEADSLPHHKTLYQAWTEILPAYEDPLSLSIAPGNQVTVLVQETAANVWLMQVTDDTTGLSQSRTVSYESSGASVEVIHERPCIRAPCTKPGDLAKLTITNPVTLDPGSVSTTPAGGSPVFNPMLAAQAGSTLVESVMYKNSRVVEATPSGSDSDLDGFTVQDGRTAPAPPAS
jgi:hypothetical protein